MNQMCTIEELVKHLLGQDWSEQIDNRILSWPPDAYAIAAAILRESGAYLEVAHQWPGPLFTSPDGWASTMERVGAAWLELVAHNLPDSPSAAELKQLSPSEISETVLLNESPATPCCPPEIMGYWKCLRSNKNCSLHELTKGLTKRPSELVIALAAIVACADEACFGMGALPPGNAAVGDKTPTGTRYKMMYAGARKLLRDVEQDEPATLCLSVRRHAATVLPKTRTPQTGMSIRCLTHNLAMLRGGEVRADWLMVPDKCPQGSEHCINLLLVPWPAEVFPNQFQAVPRSGSEPYHGSPLVRLFKFSHHVDQDIGNANVNELFRSAVKQIGRIDGVIFPELSLTESEFGVISNALRHDAAEWRGGITPARFVLGGVYSDGPNDEFGENKVLLEHTVDPLDSSHGERLRREQHKHHRWHLDEGQIRQYGLGSQLDPRRLWVEHIRLAERRVEFFNLGNQLSMCALICEDLAQSDPIAETIRAIGPNLLICLLADGPQLSSRWPSRYATTLADDPGCSVLTLTSRGMATLSQPRGGEQSRNEVIGLWKEPRGPAREIVLHPGSGAIVVSLTIATEQQWTADHRRDRHSTRNVTLSGIRQICLKGSQKAD